MLMSQGSLSPKARGSRGSTPLSWNPMMNLSSKTPSLTPSPILSLGNPSVNLANNSNPSSVPRNLSAKLASISSPEDDFVFFSDDEDEKSGKPKSPKKQQSLVHDKMHTTIRGINKLKVSKSSSSNCSSAQSVPSLNRDNSEEEAKKTTDYKLDDLEMVKTIGTGKTADYVIALSTIILVVIYGYLQCLKCNIF